MSILYCPISFRIYTISSPVNAEGLRSAAEADAAELVGIKPYQAWYLVFIAERLEKSLAAVQP